MRRRGVCRAFCVVRATQDRGRSNRDGQSKNCGLRCEFHVEALSVMPRDCDDNHQYDDVPTLGRALDATRVAKSASQSCVSLRRCFWALKPRAWAQRPKLQARLLLAVLQGLVCWVQSAQEQRLSKEPLQEPIWVHLAQVFSRSLRPLAWWRVRVPRALEQGAQELSPEAAPVAECPEPKHRAFGWRSIARRATQAFGRAVLALRPQDG